MNNLFIYNCKKKYIIVIYNNHGGCSGENVTDKSGMSKTMMKQSRVRDFHSLAPQIF